MRSPLRVWLHVVCLAGVGILAALILLPLAADPARAAPPARPAAQAEPPSSPAAVAAFRAAHASARVTVIDGIPAQIYGSGFAGGATAQAAADAFLSQHLALYGVDRSAIRSAGSLPVRGGRFTVFLYTQWVDDYPVYDRWLKVLVRNQPGFPVVLVNASILPVPNAAPAPGIDADAARARARILFPALADQTAPELAYHAPEGKTPVLTWHFYAQNDAEPPDRRHLFIDAVTGDLVDDQPGLYHTDVNGHTDGKQSPVPYPDQANNPPTTLVVPRARVRITGGNTVYANTDGNFTVPHGGTGPVTIIADFQGEYSAISNQGTGGLLNATLVVTPPGPANFIINPTPAEFRTSQVNGFVQTTRIHDAIKSWVPSLTVMDIAMPTRVNINNSCNAYATLGNSSINFYRAGNGCPNTAYASVIYHEYGHTVTDRITGGPDSGDYHEGMSDVLSAVYLNSACIGHDFFGQGTGCLRNVDTQNYSYPCTGGAHTCGLVIGGAYWDMRTGLIAAEGTTAGLQLARDYYIGQEIIGNHRIHPSVTVDVLTLDDDDDSILNGTPHYSEIDAGFSAHGLDAPELMLQDTCDGALVVPPSGPFPYLVPVFPDITFAGTTDDPPVPSCASDLSRSIWYKFTPATSSTYTFDTCIDTTGTTVRDTVMGVYTSSNGCGGTYMPLICSDDACGYGARVTTDLAAGTTYYVVIWKYGTAPPASGQTAVQLRVAREAPPNDLCASAEHIPGGGPFPYLTTVTPDIGGATTTGDPPTPSCQTSVSRSIWYAFTPAATGDYTFSSCADAPTGTTVDDTVVAVYATTAGCNGTLTQLSGGCDDNSCGSEDLQAVVTTALTAGKRYFVVVWKKDSGDPATGNTAVQLHVTRQLTTPANDLCPNAEVIAGNGPFDYLTSTTTDISNATNMDDPPPPVCQPLVWFSLWYVFTPTVTGSYTVSSCANAPTDTTVDDTILAMYTSTGGCMGSFTEVAGACDDNSCTVEANQAVISGVTLDAGTTYYILAWKYDLGQPLAGNTAVQLRVTRAAAAPANDACAAAVVIPTSGPFPYLSPTTADITDATTTGDPPLPSCTSNVSRSTWYKFTPSTTATYTLDVCGATTATTVGDTVMAVYTAATGCGSTYTPVICSDDGCGSGASVTTDLQGGTDYYVVVWKYGSDAPVEGATAVQLRVSIAPPDNDTCPRAEPIPANGPFPYLSAAIGDVSAATTAGDPPAPSCTSDLSRSVWYSFMPATTSTYTFETCAGTTGTTLADTVMGIYTVSGGCGGTYTAVACNQDSCSTQSTITTPLTAGTTYYVVVWKFGTAAPPTGSAAVQLRVKREPPANDLCANGVVIPANGPFPHLTGLVPDISAATTTGDPAAPSCTSNISRSIWYIFTPATTASYTFETCAGTTGTTVDDPVMAIYTAPACGGSYTHIACNDDSCGTESVVTASLTAGTRYALLVWQFGTDDLLPGHTAIQVRVSQTLPTSTPTSTNTPTNTPTRTNTPTATSTPLPTATSTPLPTATSTPLPTATSTPLPTATSTPLPTDTSTPLPTDPPTSTPLPTDTSTPLPTATSTPLPTATSTPLPTDTSTPLPTDPPTSTPLPTDTSTPLPTATSTPLPTDTSTPLPTATSTPLPTDTSTPLPTDTSTPLPTDTSTPLPTDTSTPLPTATSTPLPTATSTPLPTDTSTPLPTASSTLLPTDTSTPLPTATSTPLPTDPPTSTPLPTATSTATPLPTDPPTATATLPPTVTPTASVTPSGAPPVHEQSVAGGSTSSTIVTSASMTAGSGGDLYLAVVASKPNIAVTSVSGVGLTWTLVKAQCAARSQTRTEVWVAQGEGSAGTVSATFGSAPSNAVITVSRYSGAGGIGAVAGANTLGVNGACTGGTDSTGYSISLTTTSDNSLAFAGPAMRNRTHTPGAGFTERMELMQGTGGSAASAAAADKTVATAGTTTVNGTFGGTVDWAMVAVEVIPAGGGSSTPSPTPTTGPTSAPSSTPTTGPTLTPSPTLPPTSTLTPTTLPTVTSTPTPSNTPLASPTPGAPTATPTTTSTPTSTSIPSSTPLPTASPTSSGSSPMHQQSVAGGSTASTTVTSGSLNAGSSGDLYLAVVAPKPNIAVTSVTGLGLTWTLVKAQCAARSQTRTEVWVAQGEGTNGAVTATFGSAPSNAVITVSRYSGASGIGAVVGANSLGVNGACTGGTDNTSYSVNLTTTVNNSLAFGAAALRNRAHTPGAGYTERVEFMQGSGGSVAGAAAEDKVVPSAGTTAVNGSFGGTVDWAAVAVEVKP